MPVTKIAAATQANLEEAAGLLREGKLIAFPTETVYGLGADATNDRAVAAIYEAKGRPQFNPVIVHVAEASELDRVVIWSEQARQFAESFWPGPLTLVMPRHRDTKVSKLVSAGLDTIAVRIPSHPTAQKLLKAVGIPIAAPSANKSGNLSPTTPLHVHGALNGVIEMIIADGKTQVGVESTVLDLTGDKPTLLRPGGVTLEALQRIAKIDTDPVTDPKHPKAPGQLASHYAPKIPIRLDVTNAEDSEAFLLFGPPLGKRGGKIRMNLSEQGDLQEAAANLFFMLHQMDKPEFSGIAVAAVPETGLGIAINDRLRRAAAPK